MISGMVGVIKSGASMPEALAVGGGGGAVVGALASLFSEKPSLKKALTNALIGGAGGAAIGGGVHALSGAADRQVAPQDTAPPAPAPAAEPSGKMNLGLAALSGVLPGAGPAIHGGLSQGAVQGAASGGASLAAAMAAMAKYRNTNPLEIPPSAGRKAMLASVLASLGAGFVGNKLREREG